MIRKESKYPIYKFIGSEISYALLTKDNVENLSIYMIDNEMDRLLIKAGKPGWNESYLPDLKYFDFIKELRIHWTNIKDISGIKDCPKLHILNVDNDDNTNIDFSIFEELEKLVIWDRPGCETLWRLSKLEDLTIAGLKQSHFLNGIALNSIHKLRLVRSSISDLSLLERISKLIYLELDTMPKLENIDFIKKMVQLKHLLINANKVRDFSVIKKLVNLEYCSLNSKNGVLCISDFSNLKHLKLLNISGNEELRILNRELDILLGLNRFILK